MTPVITFTSPLFWLQLLYFIPVILVAFYIPGNVIVHKFKFSPFQSFVLSSIVGLVLFALQGVLFGYLHLRWLSYVYLVGMGVLWYMTVRPTRNTLKKMMHIDKKSFDPLLCSIALVGIIVQLITVWFIGFQTNDGLSFCCFWPDSFYHLALVSELATRFPPVEPGMSGVLVANYHYLANLVAAELIRIFRFSLLPIQYQLLPLYITTLLAGSVITLGSLLRYNRIFTRWLLFFVFFSGDIIFLILLLLGKGFNFQVTVSENATTLWFSPPRVYAMVILFAALSFFLTWYKKRSILLGVIVGLCIGSLVGFKIYLGFFALVGLGVVSLYFLVKKQMVALIPLIVASVVTAALYLPVNTHAGGLFFSGLWRIDDYGVRPEFGLLNLALAKQVYEANHNYLRIASIEIIYFLLYMISLFGVFLIGFLQNRRSWKMFPGVFHTFLLTGGFVSFVIGMFFLQETGGANTLQFLFSVYIVGSIYTALAITYWLGRLKKRTAVVCMVLIVMLAGLRVGWETIANVRDLIRHEGFYTVTNKEIEALQYLNHAVPDSAMIAVNSATATDDSCYVLSLIARRDFYLCGSGILEDHGVNVQERQRLVTIISTNKDAPHVKEALKQSGIQYIYVPTGFLFGTKDVKDVLKSVYNNETMEVFQVKQELL